MPGAAGTGARWVLARLAISACLLAGACGSGSRSGSPPATVLRLLMANDWAKAPVVAQAIRDFERSNPSARVNVQSVYFEEVAETARAEIDRGQPHDVVQWHAFAAGAQGLAEPLDDLWRAKLSEEDFLAGSVEDVVWSGHHYGVPLDTNAMLLLFDSKRFAEVGTGQPSGASTFGDLAAAARALSAPDGSRRALGLSSSTWHTYGWIRANGGEVVTVGPDGRPRFTFEAPEVVEAVEYLAGLARDGMAFPPAGVAGDRTDAFELLQSGTTAIHASGSWDLATLRKLPDSSRYKVAAMPRGTTGRTEGTAMGGSSLFVPKGSKQRALAFRFMTHLISDRYALRLARDEGRLPVRLRVYEDEFFQTEDLRIFLQQLRSARPFKLEAFTEAHKAFSEAVADALAGRKDVKLALDEAQQRAELSGEAG